VPWLVNSSYCSLGKIPYERSHPSPRRKGEPFARVHLRTALNVKINLRTLMPSSLAAWVRLPSVSLRAWPMSWRSISSMVIRLSPAARAARPSGLRPGPKMFTTFRLGRGGPSSFLSPPDEDKFLLPRHFGENRNPASSLCFK